MSRNVAIVYAVLGLMFITAILAPLTAIVMPVILEQRPDTLLEVAKIVFTEVPNSIMMFLNNPASAHYVSLLKYAIVLAMLAILCLITWLYGRSHQHQN